MAAGKDEIDFSGLFPALTTTFHYDQSLNLEDFKKNIIAYNKYKFRGYVVLGSTGEFPYLSTEEKQKLVQCAKDNSEPEKLLIVGAGSESTTRTLSLCQKFAEIGADAALVHTPHFYHCSMTPDALIQHYRQIADHSKIPLIMYNVPANTGLDIDACTVYRLSSHPNIIGFKDSGGTIRKLEEIVTERKCPNFKVLAGSAGFLADAMAVGCVGGICALADVLPAETLQIWELMTKGKVDEAKSLQKKIERANAMVTKRLGIPALKHMMDKFGTYYGGPTRRPLLPLTDQEKEAVEAEFRNAGFQF